MDEQLKRAVATCELIGGFMEGGNCLVRDDYMHNITKCEDFEGMHIYRHFTDDESMSLIGVHNRGVNETARWHFCSFPVKNVLQLPQHMLKPLVEGAIDRVNARSDWGKMDAEERAKFAKHPKYKQDKSEIIKHDGYIINYNKIDLMARPSIKMLNELGIRTKSCCESHIGGYSQYLGRIVEIGEESASFGYVRNDVAREMEKRLSLKGWTVGAVRNNALAYVLPGKNFDKKTKGYMMFAYPKSIEHKKQLWKDLETVLKQMLLEHK